MRTTNLANNYGKHSLSPQTRAITAESLKVGDIILSPSGFTKEVVKRLNPHEGTPISVEILDMAGKTYTIHYQNQSAVVIRDN